MVNSVNLAGIPGLNIERLLRAQDRFEFFKMTIHKELFLLGVPNDSADYVSRRLLSAWTELLHQQPVDDVNGVPLSINILPKGVTSLDFLRRTFLSAPKEALMYITEDGIRMIDHCWTAFRGSLIMSVFDGLDWDDGVALAIEIDPTTFILPANEADEAETKMNLRMFTSMSAAQDYSNRGWQAYQDNQ